MKKDSDSVLSVSKQNNIVHLVLNRPSVLNALNSALLDLLKDELTSIKENRAIKGVIITGMGEQAFSAGADIEYLSNASPLQVRELAEKAISVNSQIENLGKPVIALINGFALGGGLELAESCMLRIAVSTAKLGHPEVKIGAVAGWGGTTRLPRLIGKSRATEMLLTGKIITANEAMQIGLVNRVVESEHLQSEGEKILNEILSNAPVAVQFSWEALHRGLNLSIEESAKLGVDYFGLVASTKDFKEGTKSFIKKRKPKYKGE